MTYLVGVLLSVSKILRVSYVKRAGLFAYLFSAGRILTIVEPECVGFFVASGHNTVVISIPMWDFCLIQLNVFCCPTARLWQILFETVGRSAW